jgi:hypothetical protein
VADWDKYPDNDDMRAPLADRSGTTPDTKAEARGDALGCGEGRCGETRAQEGRSAAEGNAPTRRAEEDETGEVGARHGWSTT